MIIADLSKAAYGSLPFIWSSSRTRTLSSGPGSGPHTPLSRLTSIHISGGISRWSQASRGISNIPHVLRLSRTLVLVGHTSAVSNSSHARCKCFQCTSVEAPRVLVKRSVALVSHLDPAALKSALLWGQTYSEFLRLASGFISFKQSDCSWILAMSGTLWYISCVWGLWGERSSWRGVTSLSVNTSTQPQKKRKHSGLEEMRWDGVMLSCVCVTGGWLILCREPPASRAWRNVEFHSLTYVELKDEADQSEAKYPAFPIRDTSCWMNWFIGSGSHT